MISQRKPEWLKIRLNTTDQFREVKNQILEKRLNTVCEEARCPNRHECWGQYKTATFMILGDVCTRRCRFCAVKTGLPSAVDTGEPERVARSVLELGLRHVVITMVNRDDLGDGGSGIMAQTVTAIKKLNSGCTIEVLSSDMMGRRASIEAMLADPPEVMSHNLETVRRLTPRVRSRSEYDRSLEFLRLCREIRPHQITKSSLMAGLGETKEELEKAMDDLLAAGVKILNIGQYLQPDRTSLPVARYWTPEEFARLKKKALKKGFQLVEAGPLVRSSYHAGRQLEEYLEGFTSK